MLTVLLSMQDVKLSSASTTPTTSLHPRTAASKDVSHPTSSFATAAAAASALALPAAGAGPTFTNNGSNISNSSSKGMNGRGLQQQRQQQEAAADADALSQTPEQQQQQQQRPGDELDRLIFATKTWQQLEKLCKRRRRSFTVNHTASAVIHLANLLRFEQEAAGAAAAAAAASGNGGSSSSSSSGRSSLSSMSLSSMDDGSYWDTGAASSSYDAPWERSLGTTDHSLKASTSGRDTLYTSSTGLRKGADVRGGSERWEKFSIPAQGRNSSSSSGSSARYSSSSSSSSRPEGSGGKSPFLGLSYMLAEGSSERLQEADSSSRGDTSSSSSSSGDNTQGLLDASTMQARMQRLQQQRREEQLQRQWQRRRPRTLRQQQQLLAGAAAFGSSSSSSTGSVSYSSQEKLLHSLLQQLLKQVSQAGSLKQASEAGALKQASQAGAVKQASQTRALSPSRCAQVLSVLSRAGYSQPQLLGRLLSVAIPLGSLKRCSGSVLVHIASAVALQGLQPKQKWVQQLGFLVGLQLKGLNPNQLAQVGFGLSRLGFEASEEWAGQLAEHMYPGMGQWRPQDFEMSIQVRMRRGVCLGGIVGVW
jgi:hypothetical protein